jgi:hypothetical protein
MDTGLTLRPTGSVAQTSYVRPEAAPVREAVATQLPPAQSVTAAAATPASRNDAARAALTQSPQAREFILDPHSREVIFRVVDVRSGSVVRQMPDEAIMRLRAYARAMADKARAEGNRNPDDAV